MKGIYDRLYKDTPEYSDEIREKWGITGLLHDIDYEIAQKEDKLDRHGILFFEKEPDNTIPEDIAHGIKTHAYELTGVMPETPMDWGITCCDQLTGLIVAGALIHPEKQLAPITVEFIMKRFNEKSFARGAKRDAIILCDEKLGIPLKKFVEIVLESMKTIHTELGL